MARVTIEDCLKNVINRYQLVHLATQRTRMLFRGANPLVRCKNKSIVTALREIANRKVRARGVILPEGSAENGDQSQV